MLNTIAKSGEILSLFCPERNEWGVTEVSAALRLPKASAYALLSSLTAIGLLQRTSNSRYRLGWRIGSLNQILMSTSELRELGREGLRRLVAKFGDTAHLGVLDGPEVLYLEREAGTRSVVVPGAKIGDRAVAAHFAIGKALLAGRGRDELSRLYSVDGHNPALQSNDSAPLRISLQDLFAELADIPRTRCAFNLTPEICAVGSPIWDYSDTVVAALSVCLPTYRYKSLSKRVIEAVIGTAEWISLGLGASNSSRGRWQRLDTLSAKSSITKIPS